MYLARPSPKMAKKLRNRSESFTRAPNSQNIAGICYFCEKPDKMSLLDWKEHLMFHTGEINRFENSTFGSTNDVSAFICDLCNFVQMDRIAIEKHLMVEHEMNGVLTIPGYYSEVTLVPNMTSLKLTSKANEKRLKFVNISDRFRCGVGWCEDHLIDYPEFKTHLWENHNETESFGCSHCGEIIGPTKDSFLCIVANHAKLHGAYLFWCPYCQQVFADTVGILVHLMRQHSNDECKFRIECRKSESDIEYVGEVSIILQCNKNNCSATFSNIDKASTHFKRSHFSLNVDFTLRQLVKKTLSCSTTEVSLYREKLFARQLFDCSKCEETGFTDASLLKHFKNTHPKHPFIMKPGDISPKYPEEALGADTNLSEMLFYCLNCHEEDKQFVGYSSVQQVFSHWNSKHTKPFRFVPVAMVKCSYCDIVGTYIGLKKHHIEMHSDQIFVVSSPTDPDQCGLCNYTGHDLKKHFSKKHTIADKFNVFNPIPMNGEQLNEFKQFQGPKKRQCGHCDEMFEIKDEYLDHHEQDHPSLEPSSDKVYDDKNVHLIAGCCQTKLRPCDLFDHLNEHEFPSICSMCSFQTSDLYEFIVHKVLDHGSDNDPREWCRQMLQIYFWNSQIVFGNGLVLSKLNLIGSEYDDSNALEEFVEKFLGDKE